MAVYVRQRTEFRVTKIYYPIGAQLLRLPISLLDCQRVDLDLSEMDGGFWQKSWL